MGPYCKFCNNRCFIHMPMDTPAHILEAYGTNTLIATCPAGQTYEKETIGYCWEDINRELALRRAEGAIEGFVATSRGPGNEVFAPCEEENHSECVVQTDTLYRDKRIVHCHCYCHTGLKFLPGRYAWDKERIVLQVRDSKGWVEINDFLAGGYEFLGATSTGAVWHMPPAASQDRSFNVIVQLRRP